MRRLENEVIRERYHGQAFLGFEETNPIKVSINQFYGIEINDFAVTVGTTALWISEAQMLRETERIIHRDIDFLPLKSYANIKEGNALRMNWSTLEKETSTPYLYAKKLNVFKVEDLPEEALSSPSMVSEQSVEYNKVHNELNVVTQEIEEKRFRKSKKPVVYDHIMGNPPFVGARLMSESQKSDVLSVFGNVKNAGNLDYVSCWYKKAADLMKGTNTRAALVSTNSITQGEQVAILWKALAQMGVKIDFAYRTFRWDSEADIKAHVHCVIVGFSCTGNAKSKTIYLNDSQFVKASNINGYLIDAPDVFVESRKKPLSSVPEMLFGSMPNDGGNFIVSDEEAAVMKSKYPESERFIKEFLGAEEFINNKKRFCLWLVNASPAELRRIPPIMERIERVRKLRSESKRAATQRLAYTPMLFGEIRQPESGTYLLVPSTSSEKRRYVPLGFFDCNVISSNANLIVPNASLYHFGILTSNVHMAWMRAVCGRLEMRYRYSASIVYNNFPWPNPTEAQKAKIEQTAQGILDARAKFPDCSLADLYDEAAMSPELRHAHQENDRAVMQAYGLPVKSTFQESECVAKLFKMYQEMVK